MREQKIEALISLRYVGIEVAFETRSSLLV